MLVQDVIVEESPGSLARRAAALFAAIAEESVLRRGRFVAALAGGSTPREAYGLLARPPLSRAVRWGKTFLFWGDERCVAADDPRSSFGAARDGFLKDVALTDAHLNRIRGELGAEAAARDYEERMARFFGLGGGEVPSFDLAFLGVGADGHTASLFPGDAALEELKRLAVPVERPPPDVDRVTLTLPVLNGARLVVFLVTGGEKADVVKGILGGETPHLPAARVKPGSGRLLWLLDRAAAAQLGEG
jgi:6-phosphogluconolactonase